MPIYRFAIHQGAIETEKLGVVALVDDAEALAFAKRMIEDTIADSAGGTDDDCPCYYGRAVAITDGARTVGRIGYDGDLGP